MSDELSLAMLTAVTLTEGIRFLYDQAGALLTRRRERDPAEPEGTPAGAPEETLGTAPEGTRTPAVVARPSVLPAADPVQLERFAAELRALRADLHEYVSGVDPVDPADGELVARVEALRRVLEVVHGTPLVFSGEPAPAAVVRGSVDADEVAGYVAAVRAERATGPVEGRVRVHRVERGGEAIGVDLGAGRPGA
ncbi:hypothetical protein [Streptomyces sp. URMC 123]|uniref:hypothetical protein n=1 Tax=Streptomyces sp. URMC 123 TaxID=3423403 RepID=UPI003F1CABFC